MRMPSRRDVPEGQPVGSRSRAGNCVETLVVGGGLVGTSAGWHLARAGHRVAVLAPRHSGMASTAAAGMLTPGCEWNGWMPEHFLTLLLSGRDYYPRFLPELTGRDPGDGYGVGYRRTDYLYLDSCERNEQMGRHYESLSRAGLAVTHLGLRDTLRREPGLNLAPVRGSLRIEGDAVVDPRAVLAALRADLADRDVLCDDIGALVGVTDHGDRFTMTTASGTRISAERVVIAAGAWTQEIASMFGIDVPVAPIRGQIIELHGGPGAVCNILYIATGACGSIVERYPGVYIVGTSEEGTSGEVANTPVVVAAVLARVTSLIPELGTMSIADMWSGFRPTTPDEMPVIGTALDGRVVLATGHYRNGVLLGPLTGQLVRDIVLDAAPAIDITPYQPDRSYGKQYRLAARY
jgi:glycine oxidase